jgi:hypothetical protein
MSACCNTQHRAHRVTSKYILQTSAVLTVTVMDNLGAIKRGIKIKINSTPVILTHNLFKAQERQYKTSESISSI